MTEADIYPLLEQLAGGNVFPYIVPLDPEGAPVAAPPWIVYAFITQKSADVFAGSAETKNNLQISVYAPTLAQAQEIRAEAAAALAPLMPAEFLRVQAYDTASGLYRATLEVMITT